jgi:transcriptional regulator with XRE-family HTH domain
MPFFQKKVTTGERGFGEELKELRELRGVSREDLSRQTGIHALLIQAFEEERLAELADPAYDERHVRRLVQVLEGREAYFLEKYRKLLQQRGIADREDVLLRPRVRRRDFFVTSHAMVFAGFLCLVLLIAGYVVWQARAVSSPPPLRVSSPAEGQRLLEAKAVIDGTTEPGSIVTINGDPIVVDAEGHFHLMREVTSGVSTLRFEARRRHGVPTVLERHVTFERILDPTIRQSSSTQEGTSSTTTEQATTTSSTP